MWVARARVDTRVERWPALALAVGLRYPCLDAVNQLCTALHQSSTVPLPTQSTFMYVLLRQPHS